MSSRSSDPETMIFDEEIENGVPVVTRLKDIDVVISTSVATNVVTIASVAALSRTDAMEEEVNVGLLSFKSFITTMGVQSNIFASEKTRNLYEFKNAEVVVDDVRASRSMRRAVVTTPDDEIWKRKSAV